MKTKHEVVKEYVLQRIETGYYRPHQMIDSENELAQILKVSRVTVRKAYDDLVNEKVLLKQHGRGTFVRAVPDNQSFRNGIGISAEAKRQGLKVESRSCSLKAIDADETLSQALSIPIGALIWEVKRTRYIENQPIVFECGYYPVNLVGEITVEDCSASLFELLESRNIYMDYADQHLTAINADEMLCEQLNVQINEALIKMDVIVYMDNGTPFNAGSAIYNTKSYKLLQTVYNN